MAEPAEFARGGRRWLMTALLLAVFMASLDTSIASIAFKDLVDGLHSSPTVVVWVVLGYLIAAAGPMVFMTRFADVIGHGRSFKIGATLYGLMTVLCGLAPDVSSLIAMRSLQGLAVAMFLPSSLVLGDAAYPAQQRGRMLGVLAAGAALGFMLGPTFGSWLLDSYGWRSIFLARLPLSIAVVSLALWVIRPGPLGDRLRSLRQLDMKDALLPTAGLFGILFAINRLPVDDNYRDPLAWAVLVAALVLLALFLRRRSGSRGPPGDLDLHRQSPGFARAALADAAMFASLPVFLFALPTVLLTGLEMRARDVGLTMATAALIFALLTGYAGKWSRRVGPERLCLAGAACVFLGYLTLLLIRSGVPLAQLMIPVVLIGTGAGLFLSPSSSSLTGGLPAGRLVAASGLVGAIRLCSYALGVAVTASLIVLVQSRLDYIWGGRAGKVLPPPEALRLESLFERGGVWSPDVMTLALHVAALLAAAMVLVTVVYSIRGVAFRPRSHALAVAASAVFAGLSIPALLERSEVTGTGDEPAVPAIAAQSPVAPFGLASRPRIKLPPRPGALGTTGAEVFEGMCAACHGKDGRGLPPPVGFEIDLTTSGFIAETPDRSLAEFIREGRRIDDLRNTTGLPMPAMGDEIPEDRIELLVQHLRSLRQ